MRKHSPVVELDGNIAKIHDNLMVIVKGTSDFQKGDAGAGHVFKDG
jgi:hypothetical protein